MIQVGGTIYKLQYALTFGELTGISSTAYNVESIDEDREKAIIVEYGLKLPVSLFHVENQTLLRREQQVPTDDITERYVWTTDIESGMKKVSYITTKVVGLQKPQLVTLSLETKATLCTNIQLPWGVQPNPTL